MVFEHVIYSQLYQRISIYLGLGLLKALGLKINCRTAIAFTAIQALEHRMEC